MKNLYILILIFSPFVSNAQLSSGLVAWWPFTGNAADSSGNAHISIPYNITYDTGMNGLPNSAASFNGHNSYVEVAYKPDLNLTKFSICAKIKATHFYDSLCQTNMIVCRGVQTHTPSYALHFFDNAFDGDDCYARDTTKNVFGGWAGTYYGSSTQFQYTPTIQLNNWYTAVMTYEDDTMCFYVNGIKKSTYVGTGPLDSNTDGLNIGANFQLTIGYSYWFEGLMDDLRIYNRVLADSEIVTYSLSVNNTVPEPIDVHMYPNPANNHITIEGKLNTTNTVQLTITNSIGQYVYRQDIMPANGILKHGIDITELNTGLYFVHLMTNGESKTLKLIVKH
ncbi:MAG: T9SS type A sorting domain-containing protein [Bacteroidetes bacterium]|nr:T9SS type A sorting domain-containing protein [Bacteroidota bacterium]